MAQVTLRLFAAGAVGGGGIVGADGRRDPW